ncbi:hypothetical protein UMM65_02650 [Aureibaculum sp. 2210JD6-5]|uniref:hypothetical protein n=1 Tax=Aureibaculum sp. 2210JD6-5 TaxID=3103957 RepID=UPI002AAEA595|nr:hypothetical protein [Aureibaculum sp. 2210JD6-5]MDY7394125.1 hypothetical protein [Aureibaculum sp. 2210JD6-5]
MSNKNFEIKQGVLWINISRAIFLGWIIFAAIQYERNPFFFGLTIAVAFLLILQMPRKSLELSNKSILLKENRILPLLNSETEIPINQLEGIKFEKGEWSLSRFILDFIGPGNIGFFGKKPSYLSYKLKNEDWIQKEAIGSPEENEKLIILVEKLKTNEN